MYPRGCSPYLYSHWPSLSRSANSTSRHVPISAWAFLSGMLSGGNADQQQRATDRVNHFHFGFSRQVWLFAPDSKGYATVGEINAIAGSGADRCHRGSARGRRGREESHQRIAKLLRFLDVGYVAAIRNLHQ